MLDGEVTLAELSEDHDIDLQHEDIVTIAGLVLAKKGFVPEHGDRLEVRDYRLTIEEVSGLKITRVRLEKIGKPR